MQERSRNLFLRLSTPLSVNPWAALGAALTGFAGFFLRRNSPYGGEAGGGILFLFLPAAALCILGICVYGYSRHSRSIRRRGWILVLGFGICLAWGAAAGERLGRQELRLGRGIREQTIARAAGVVTADGRRDARGQMVAALGVRRVMTGGVIPAEAGARFPLRVVLRDGSFLRRGERVEVGLAGGIPPGEGGGKEPVWAYARRGGVRRLGWVSPWSALRASFLGRAGQALEPLKPGTAGLAEALLWGGKNGLPEGWEQAYRGAGCAHLLALSGMHVGVLVSLLVAGLGRFWGRRRAARLGAVLLAGYPFLAGMQPSLIRAVGFFGLRAWVRPLQGCTPVFTLTLIMLMQMMVFPGSPERLSFQLSYAALFGILLATPDTALFLEKYLPPCLAVPLAASVSAQAGTLPVLLLSLGEFHPVGIGASLILTPLITFFMAAALLYMTLTALTALPAASLLPGFSLALDSGILRRIRVPLMDGTAGLTARGAALFAAVPGVTGGPAWLTAGILLLAGLGLAVRTRHREGLAMRRAYEPD